MRQVDSGIRAGVDDLSLTSFHFWSLGRKCIVQIASKSYHPKRLCASQQQAMEEGLPKRLPPSLKISDPECSRHSAGL